MGNRNFRLGGSILKQNNTEEFSMKFYGMLEELLQQIKCVGDYNYKILNALMEGE